jgi:hypothetical protein
VLDICVNSYYTASVSSKYTWLGYLQLTVSVAVLILRGFLLASDSNMKLPRAWAVARASDSVSMFDANVSRIDA